MSDQRHDNVRPAQPDLFAHVLGAYATAPEGELDNRTLYERVADSAGMSSEERNRRAPVGASGKPYGLFARAVRWHQQTLKHMGCLQRVASARGVWHLGTTTKSKLFEARPGVRLVAFSTNLGVALWGGCRDVFATCQDEIVACITSPPYPLARPRAYGNVDEGEFTDFICRALEPIIRRLARGGSLCLNLGNDIFLAGVPARSLYRERLVLALTERFSLFKLDDMVWFNPSRAPSPVQWASKQRVQLNASYEIITWLTNDPARVRSDNRRVLLPHTERHLKLIAAGGEHRRAEYADGAHTVRAGSFAAATQGRIPRNVLTVGHRCADTNQYRRDAQALGLPVHGAMMPIAIPEFLIRFLSEPGELIIDPFGGTCTTARAAEKLGRRWLVSEIMLEYLRGAAPRFSGCDGFSLDPCIRHWPHAA